MEMTEWKIQEFVDLLASDAPTPGGGGASALVGAVGTALGGMVGSLTAGKKKYADVEDEILRLKGRSEEIRQHLLSMMEKDAEAFAPLAKAYGLPKGTEEEKRTREQVMEQALRRAAEPPLEIMELCVDALRAVERFGQIGSRLAVSDAGCAAACCRAALHAAALNVFINTNLMRDRAYAEELNHRAAGLIRDGSARADAAFAGVCKELNCEGEFYGCIAAGSGDGKRAD